MDLRRRRFRCRTCGSEIVPLYVALGLEPRIQHRLGVRERALWLVTELSYARTAATKDHFSDDNGTTHEKNVNRLAQAGLTKGCGSGRYCPNNVVTRGQMAAFLHRSMAE